MLVTDATRTLSVSVMSSSHFEGISSLLLNLDKILWLRQNSGWFLLRKKKYFSEGL